jgi:aspartyl/asparaginyl beta-hydroxylase (cupin superfamily)
MNQEHFLESILDNWEKIMVEYNTVKRTIPLYNFDPNPKQTFDWRAITLWWNYKGFETFQKQMPFTTKLLEIGPTHRATGWLLLHPNSTTPTHCHKDWGHKIILHIPTYIPRGDVGFSVDGKIHRYKDKELFAFDCYQNHYGFNNTNEIRSIMVLDFEYDTWYNTLKKYMYLS